MSGATRDAPPRRLDAVVAAFRAEADAEQAEQMTRYMKGRFPFFGLKAPHRRATATRITATWPDPSEADLFDLLADAWRREEREIQYFAIDHLVRHRRILGADALGPLTEAITHRSWWDTVDAIASGLVGDIVSRVPATAPTVAGWSRHDDTWMRRTALLHQLKFGTDTDQDLLFSMCVELAPEDDFFIRKAIGWALRQYARVAPGEVRRFVDEHGSELSPLSVREASRRL